MRTPRGGTKRHYVTCEGVPTVRYVVLFLVPLPFVRSTHASFSRTEEGQQGPACSTTQSQGAEGEGGTSLCSAGGPKPVWSRLDGYKKPDLSKMKKTNPLPKQASLIDGRLFDRVSPSTETS